MQLETEKRQLSIEKSKFETKKAQFDTEKALIESTKESCRTQITRLNEEIDLLQFQLNVLNTQKKYKMAYNMSNVIRNSEVNDFYKANGKEKCTEYLKENDINFYTKNVCADKMSYEYSLINL